MKIPNMKERDRVADEETMMDTGYEPTYDELCKTDPDYMEAPYVLSGMEIAFIKDKLLDFIDTTANIEDAMLAKLLIANLTEQYNNNHKG